MAFGTRDETDVVMTEINMTPPDDVMLVLLIIFIVTVPVMKHAVNIDLARASNVPQDVKLQRSRLACAASASLTSLSVPSSRSASCAAGEGYRPRAAIPARATCASSCDLTPLTPTAPRQ